MSKTTTPKESKKRVQTAAERQRSSRQKRKTQGLKTIRVERWVPVKLSESPQWVEDSYYPRMTRNEEFVCENKHMFRRFHRDRIKDAFRQPGRSSKDPYDPAAKLDEA
jgi:hypothetical protein